MWDNPFLCVCVCVWFRSFATIRAVGFLVMMVFGMKGVVGAKKVFLLGFDGEMGEGSLRRRNELKCWRRIQGGWSCVCCSFPSLGDAVRFILGSLFINTA